MQAFKDLLKKNNIKITPQRNVIYQELVRSQDHPYAESVFKRVRKIFPNISYDTVYRTLMTFKEIGIIDIVEGYGEPRRFDTNIRPHHHFRCLNCNKIIDIENKGLDDLKIPKELDMGLKVKRFKVLMEGICPDCQ